MQCVCFSSRVQAACIHSSDLWTWEIKWLWKMLVWMKQCLIQFPVDFYFLPGVHVDAQLSEESLRKPPAKKHCGRKMNELNERKHLGHFPKRWYETGHEYVYPCFCQQTFKRNSTHAKHTNEKTCPQRHNVAFSCCLATFCSRAGDMLAVADGIMGMFWKLNRLGRPTCSGVCYRRWGNKRPCSDSSDRKGSLSRRTSGF